MSRDTNKGVMMRCKKITPNLLTRQWGDPSNLPPKIFFTNKCLYASETHTRPPLSLYLLLLYVYKLFKVRKTRKRIWILRTGDDSLSYAYYNIERGTYQREKENDFWDTYTPHPITTKKKLIIFTQMYDDILSPLLVDCAHSLFVEFQFFVSGCFTTHIS